ncbi:MAG: two-component sensor histidine kinase [Desulfobacca sp.]|nr:two-component sensor histidine kinase [Desulfobacca sp.]
MTAAENNHQTNGDKQKAGHYSRLYRKFVFLTLISSLVPLLLVGWGIYIYYSNFSGERMKASFQYQVESHRKIIELFLKERTHDLQLVALTHSLDQIQKQPILMRVLDGINREGQYFTDLGVISDQGKHLAYIGPYDLMDKNYSQTFWFKELMKKGFFVSDMFTGFRSSPHIIIAFLRIEGEKRWIIRASIDTEYLRSLVENVKIGSTGEVYLLNQTGILQTSSRFGGKIMDKAPLPVEQFQEDSGIRTLTVTESNPARTSSKQIVAYAWLKDPQWLLVVKQEYDEAFRDVNHANRATLVFLHLSLLGIIIITAIITRTMVKTIKKRDRESEQLNKQLIQTGKLASLGELSAGVAHEINNPLAIILMENQVIRDSFEEYPDLEGVFKEQLEDSLSQIDSQVQRCNLITHNLLRFSRRTISQIESVDINAFLQEVIQLMTNRAKGMGIQFSTDLEKELAPILSDPSQLQQVFLNLINNAIDAHEGKPYGNISIRTQSDLQHEGVKIEMADTGSGIPQENLERIFDPFFTTKPVGKGTGLGLSISYSLIKKLGGDISVQSEPGKGTQFTLFLPFKLSEDSGKNVEEHPEQTAFQNVGKEPRK